MYDHQLKQSHYTSKTDNKILPAPFSRAFSPLFPFTLPPTPFAPILRKISKRLLPIPNLLIQPISNASMYRLIPIRGIRCLCECIAIALHVWIICWKLFHG